MVQSMGQVERHIGLLLLHVLGKVLHVEVERCVILLVLRLLRVRGVSVSERTSRN